ncbi:hypothetical protein P9112_008238 [Eukaryota sp. TZLM1-RC]
MDTLSSHVLDEIHHNEACHSAVLSSIHHIVDSALSIHDANQVERLYLPHSAMWASSLIRKAVLLQPIDPISNYPFLPSDPSLCNWSLPEPLLPDPLSPCIPVISRSEIPSPPPEIPIITKSSASTRRRTLKSNQSNLNHNTGSLDKGGAKPWVRKEKPSVVKETRQKEFDKVKKKRKDLLNKTAHAKQVINKLSIGAKEITFDEQGEPIVVEKSARQNTDPFRSVSVEVKGSLGESRDEGQKEEKRSKKRVLSAGISFQKSADS